jgi:hypothetical protein
VGVDRTSHGTDKDVEVVEDDADQRPPRLPPDTPGAPGIPSRLDSHQVAAAINKEQAETSCERDPGASKPAEDVTAEQSVETAENKPETGEQEEAGEFRAAADVASREASPRSAEAESAIEQPGPVIPLNAEAIGEAALDEEVGATAEAVEKEILAEYDDDVVRDGRPAPTGESDDPPDATPTSPNKLDEDNDAQPGVLGEALSDDQRSPAPLDHPRTEPTEQPESTEVSATDAVGAATGDAATNGGPEDSTGNGTESKATESPGLPSDLRMGVPDEPGSWRGDGGQYLNMEENLVTDQALDRIRDVEPHVTGDLSAIEGEIPNGQLVGLEYRLKGEDRFKEKVSYETRRKPERSLGEIAERVPDVVRYTYQFDKEHYVQGCATYATGWRIAGMS